MFYMEIVYYYEKLYRKAVFCKFLVNKPGKALGRTKNQFFVKSKKVSNENSLVWQKVSKILFIIFSPMTVSGRAQKTIFRQIKKFFKWKFFSMTNSIEKSFYKLLANDGFRKGLKTIFRQIKKYLKWKLFNMKNIIKNDFCKFFVSERGKAAGRSKKNLVTSKSIWNKNYSI